VNVTKRVRGPRLVQRNGRAATLFPAVGFRKLRGGERSPRPTSGLRRPCGKGVT